MSIDRDCFDSVCEQARNAMLLQTTADTLEWDERTGLPRHAGDYRAEQVSSLRALAHQQRTESDYGDRLERLLRSLDGRDPTEDIPVTVRQLHRDWQRDRKLPTDLVQRISAETIRGQQCWEEARREDDFQKFRSALETIVQLKREAGDRLREGTDRSIYEALVDEFEPDARVDQLQSSFDQLRRPLVDLIGRIRDATQQPDRTILNRHFDIQDQRRFSRLVAERIGFDFERGRLDETVHPFCTTLGPNDCRILTRFDAQWLPSGLFGTMHEAGHGMYEQGLRRDWFGLPPGSFTSLGIHESQSRLWENQVGRSRSFWQWLYPEIQQAFDASLGDVTLESFHRAINSVQPSLIRVEADEATYNLHIIIRFDLERQLVEGSLEVEDLPEAWNARYQSDLGVMPDSDANGVLQDVHWAAGLFGYFPTYTLGNMASAQLFDAAEESIGDLHEAFTRGEFQSLLDWLRAHVHQHGRALSGNDLVEKATGKPFGAESLVRYLKTKFEPLYGLDGS